MIRRIQWACVSIDEELGAGRWHRDEHLPNRKWNKGSGSDPAEEAKVQRRTATGMREAHSEVFRVWKKFHTRGGRCRDQSRNGQ